MPSNAQLYNYFVSFAAALGGLLFGYETGIINSVLEMDPFQLFFGLAEFAANGTLTKTADSTSRVSTIVSFFLLGCIPGALFIAFAADVLGRKKSIWLGAILFTAGALIQALVSSSSSISGRVAAIMSGRFIGGLGVGILSMTVPLFIAELAPADSRGRMTSVQQLMITIGIAIASIINAIIIGAFKNATKDNDIQWRLALGIQAGPGFLLVLLLFLLPESPRWLVSQGRNDEGLVMLAKLRQAEAQSSAVQQELHDMTQSIEAEKQIGSASWGELMRPGIRNRLVIGVMLQFFQQWTGVNAVMYFSSSLFMGMGVSKATATTVAVVVQSSINVLGTLPGMYLIERAGRTKLLKWGGVGMATCMWTLVIFVNLFNSASAGLSPEAFPAKAQVYSAISVAAMFTFVFFFASTTGATPWVLQSEIFPARVRGKGTGISTASNWINNYIISAIWPFVSEALGAQQYAIFGCTCLVMTAYVHLQVPETKGKTLEQMDEVFGFKATELHELKA
ncbi:hypothetical protein H9P43_003828 [Blastocladiella emersonii ATCC 22665]|nr:hypothetical protein H9P43_003828 [Blastocladiella emersonii ATCC 22665]